jgi:Intraflagellar transport complex B protein 46 C terminal
LPSAELAVTTEEMTRITCALVDIPVRDGKMIESLDVLFNLFAAFKDSHHFGGQKEESAFAEADVLALTQDAEE